jgi:hypothetical protein
MKILLSGEDELPFTHCDFQRRWRVEARRRTRPSPHRLIKTKSQYADCLGDLIYNVIARQRAANPSRTIFAARRNCETQGERILAASATLSAPFLITPPLQQALNTHPHQKLSIHLFIFLSVVSYIFTMCSLLFFSQFGEHNVPESNTPQNERGPAVVRTFFTRARNAHSKRTPSSQHIGIISLLASKHLTANTAPPGAGIAIGFHWYSLPRFTLFEYEGRSRCHCRRYAARPFRPLHSPAKTRAGHISAQSKAPHKTPKTLRSQSPCYSLPSISHFSGALTP